MDIYNVRTLADETGWDKSTIYELARTEQLPIRYAPGRERGGVILYSEFEEWLKNKGFLKEFK